MNKKIQLFFLIIAIFAGNANAQDPTYARTVIDSLASPIFQGRGYVFSGDKYAAKFIASELSRFNLKSYTPQFKQGFNVSVNTFPGAMDVTINELPLKPGEDYIVAPYSTGIKGSFEVAYLTKSIIANQKLLEEFMKKDYSKKVIVVERADIVDAKQIEIAETMRDNPLKAKAIVFIVTEKLTWGASSKTAKYTLLEVKKSQFTSKIKTITFNIENQFIENYGTQNIVGFVKGNLYPDSVIVIAAHYDHLGRMGSATYFPGANDNASGVATALSLADYYGEADNQPQYSIAFMFFGGEELGLLGSSYYVENPLFPLKSIKFFINLDLVGTGEEGIKVVNGTIFTEQFKTLTLINNQNSYFKEVSKRGEAANSDHYPFYKKGVRSFYIYTLGGAANYHDIYDKSDAITLPKFESLFELITNFIEAF